MVQKYYNVSPSASTVQLSWFYSSNSIDIVVYNGFPHIIKDFLDIPGISGTSEVEKTALSYLSRNYSYEHVMYKPLSTEMVSFRTYRWKYSILSYNN